MSVRVRARRITPTIWLVPNAEFNSHRKGQDQLPPVILFITWYSVLVHLSIWFCCSRETEGISFLFYGCVKSSFFLLKSLTLFLHFTIAGMKFSQICSNIYSYGWNLDRETRTFSSGDKGLYVIGVCMWKAFIDFFVGERIKQGYSLLVYVRQLLACASINSKLFKQKE